MTTGVSLSGMIDLSFFMFAGYLFAYLFPTFIAVARGKRHPGAAVVVNVFLGWTIIGWIVALAMAVAGDTNGESARI